MRWGSTRKNRRGAALCAATLICFGGCAGQTSLQPQTAQNHSVSPVQQAVTAAWEADRAGDSEAALAGYLEVLAEDPGNKWAKARVERLSAAMPKGETMIAGAPAAGGTRVPTRQSAQPQDKASQTTAVSPASLAAKSDPVGDQSFADRSASKQPSGSPAVNPFAEFMTAGADTRPDTTTVASDRLAADRDASVAGQAPLETLADRIGQTPRSDSAAVAHAPDGSASRETAFTRDPFAENPFETLASSADPTAERAQPPVSNVSFSPRTQAPQVHTYETGADAEVLSLLGDLSSPLPEARSEALSRLAVMGDEALAAVPAIELLVVDRSEFVRVDAAWARYQITGDAGRAVDSFRRLLATTDRGVRMKAVQSLGLIGPAAEPAVADLRLIATSSSSIDSIQVNEAIVRIAPADRAAPANLVEATRYGRAAERAEAVYAIGSLPVERASEVVPALTNALHDDDEPVRVAAALTLGHFGKHATSARHSLEAAARFDTEPVRGAARASLACLPQ